MPHSLESTKKIDAVLILVHNFPLRKAPVTTKVTWPAIQTLTAGNPGNLKLLFLLERYARRFGYEFNFTIQL